MRTNTPGDNCDDQQMDCCCNSVSWALSMLCMNCQLDTQSGDSIGIDAGVGAYQMYLTRSDGTMCSPNTNQSLPTNVQSAVCNENIHLANFLYNLFWSDGPWWVCLFQGKRGDRPGGQQQPHICTLPEPKFDHHIFLFNNFVVCVNIVTVIFIFVVIVIIFIFIAHPIRCDTSTSLTSSTTPPQKSTSNLGAIVGGAVGGGLGLLILVLIVILLLRRKSKRRSFESTDFPTG
ncbi:hypothetical protein A0H81_12665 [Grifola frondosa]|uniref:Uncharacterized protein n=1 Tax=Grifola frondosa TaxID=5627 RepID=A0A1C7LRL7_GRIFR|nr:hypothetical protein A0H81_12665 [Grifola frondosa]